MLTKSTRNFEIMVVEVWWWWSPPTNLQPRDIRRPSPQEDHWDSVLTCSASSLHSEPPCLHLPNSRKQLTWSVRGEQRVRHDSPTPKIGTIQGWAGFSFPLFERAGEGVDPPHEMAKDSQAPEMELALGGRYHGCLEKHTTSVSAPRVFLSSGSTHNEGKHICYSWNKKLGQCADVVPGNTCPVAHTRVRTPQRRASHLGLSVACRVSVPGACRRRSPGAESWRTHFRSFCGSFQQRLCAGL